MIGAVVRAMHPVLPCQVRTCVEIDDWIGESPGWTRRKTGVERRHVAAPDESVADLGARAVREVVQSQGLTFADIDAIVFASGTREQYLPSTAALVANRLGPETRGIPCFDVDATCLGFVLGLELMSRALATGMYRRIVLASSEVPSRGLDPAFKEAAALFGDGAVAAILETPSSEPEGEPFEPFVRQIGPSRFETFGEGAHFTEVRVGTAHDPKTKGYDPHDFTFMMQGPQVYELASREFPGFLERFLSDAGFGLDDFDFIVPHQASKPAVELLARKLGARRGGYAQDYKRFGNTVSASIPLSLAMARAEGRIVAGDRVLLTGTAAGLTMGAMALQI